MAAAAINNKIKQLKAMRDILINRLNEAHAFANRPDLETDNTMKLQFKLRGANLPELFKKFGETHESLIGLMVAHTANPDMADEDVKRANFETVYFYVKAIYDNLFSDTTQPIVVAQQNRAHVKLPKISLPEFNGDVRKWPHFIDLFDSLVHSNTSISDVEKFHYLVSALSGDPLALVNTLPITDVNYDTAYKSLVGRYQNKRLLATAYWQEIVNSPKVELDSPRALRQLLDTFKENVSALSKLNFPTDYWDFVLFSTMLQKLDINTATRFELEHSKIQIPSFQQLMDFIENQCKALDSLSYNKPVKKSSAKSTNSQNQRSKKQQGESLSVNSIVVRNQDCLICKKPHSIYRCDTLLAKTPRERYQLAKQHQLCLNCLSSKHFTKSCSSRSTCNICKQTHHSLLHFENSTQTPISSSLSSNTNSQSCEASTSTASQSSQTTGQPLLKILQINCRNLKSTVLLPTAQLEILNSKGIPIKFRALIDTGSMGSFITASCCKTLGLIASCCDVPIQVFGKAASTAALGKVNGTIRSCYDHNFEIVQEFIVMTDICDRLPQSFFPLSSWPHLAGLDLADPYFNVPAPIEVLLGADLLSQIWRSSLKIGEVTEPIAIETSLGWIVTGKFQCPRKVTPKDSTFALPALVGDSKDLDSTLQQFWMLEEIPHESTSLSANDELCEKIFVDSHFRDKNGRFHVRLPFKGIEPLFCNSRTVAIKRYLSLERKLLSSPTLQLAYSELFLEYLNSNQMELVHDPTAMAGPQKMYYIPHHSVFKADSSTTKVRIVFDASTKNGPYSLNDHLLSGPKLQNDLPTVLLRFRLHIVAFTADIKQMFRQICVVDEHCDYQRIVWRFSPQEPIQDYRINVVTFGLASSPFLALRCLLQLAKDEQADLPKAADVIVSDIYVDDIVTGTQTLEEALMVKSHLVELLKRGQFELRKWSCNNQEFLDTVPIEEQEQFQSFDKESDFIKILGLHWCPIQDCFSYHTSSLAPECTKRIILSQIARVFDPLGFITPLSLFTKHLMQVLWYRGLDWDDPAPDDIRNKWLQYKSELPLLSSLKISRRIVWDHSNTLEIHGFADASELGYAAVIYSRSVSPTGEVTISFVTAKSKVAPLKRISLPRLELCAAVLLANLISFVVSTFNSLKIDRICAWSDSTVALNWIKSEPYRWKTFIANRITKIQEKVPAANWFHVSSAENPADCASRGLLPAAMLNFKLWWNGPAFLLRPRESWPASISTCENDETQESITMEQRKLVLVVTRAPLDTLDNLLSRFSSLSKIVRIVAYLFRFIRPPVHGKRSDPIMEYDFNKAVHRLVGYVQSRCFAEDISLIKGKQPCSKPLRRLSPFLDEEGLLRVGGRLSRSKLPYDQKHPVLLPKNHRLTILIIEYYHNKYLHPGSQALHFLIAQNFWIVSARSVIRSCVNNCLKCFRANPRPAYAKMADLPSFRVSQIKAFQFVGVDFGGPFDVSTGRIRGAKVTKAYLCLFVCAATKALHLELVSQLSTDAFLAGLRRFIARRGRCSDLFSDQGTNFVGAARYLAECMEEAALSEKITWHFNPPAASHFGGLYEAGIKSVKSHLVRVVGNQILTYEELYTILTQVEAVLNSRPLCELSNDPNDLLALTPGHFLTLNPLSTVPDPDLTSLKINRLDRWQLLVRIHQDFWGRWHNEYLHTLQQRAKWTEHSRNMEINTLVLIKNEQIRPLDWLLGRVVEVHPGADGVVRVATVRTANGNFKRPISKLCPLPRQ